MTDNVLNWREALGEGRFDEARRLYLLEDSPDPAIRRAIDVLADVQESVRENNWARATRRLDRLEEAPPIIDWTHFEDEVAWLHQISTDAARNDSAKVLDHLRGREYVWFAAEAANARGNALIQEGELERARSEFEEAARLDPKHYRALTNLGNACLEQGDPDLAIECYRKALAINEEFPNAHHNLGVAYRRKGNVTASVRHLRRAERVRQRVEKERSREAVGKQGGAGALKMIRWSMWALGALVIYLVLQSQGFL